MSTPNFGPAVNPHATVGRENSTGHFDWGQWDAVFGQHVAVDDLLMDMDWEGDHDSASARKDEMDSYDNH